METFHNQQKGMITYNERWYRLYGKHMAASSGTYEKSVYQAAFWNMDQINHAIIH